MTFSQFYQQGGVFMHFITLAAIGAGVSIVRRVRASRSVLRTGAQGRHPLDGGATPWLVAAGLCMGMCGTTLGIIEMAHALQTLPTEHWPLALARAGSIAVVPLTWATLIFVPVLLAHAALRPFEARLRTTLRNVGR